MEGILINTVSPLESLRAVLGAKAEIYPNVYFNAKGEWLFREKGEFNIVKSTDEVMHADVKSIDELLIGSEVNQVKPSKKK